MHRAVGLTLSVFKIARRCLATAIFNDDHQIMNGPTEYTAGRFSYLLDSRFKDTTMTTRSVFSITSFVRPRASSSVPLHLSGRRDFFATFFEFCSLLDLSDRRNLHSAIRVGLGEGEGEWTTECVSKLISDAQGLSGSCTRRDSCWEVRNSGIQTSACSLVRPGGHSSFPL